MGHRAGGDPPVLRQRLQPRPFLLGQRDVVLGGQAAWGPGLRRQDFRDVLSGNQCELHAPSLPPRPRSLQPARDGLLASESEQGCLLGGLPAPGAPTPATSPRPPWLPCALALRSFGPNPRQ